MAYVTTVQVKQTREALKLAFPDFKFMVRKGNWVVVAVSTSVSCQWPP